jgi:2-oxo-4-hydroxy-4-carboxy--5-ureidoimidazoline (OHCU) decarboxylase
MPVQLIANNFALIYLVIPIGYNLRTYRRRNFPYIIKVPGKTKNRALKGIERGLKRFKRVNSRAELDQIGMN